MAIKALGSRPPDQIELRHSQESGASVGGSCSMSQDLRTRWFLDGLPLGQLLSIHRLRFVVKLLLTWPSL